MSVSYSSPPDWNVNPANYQFSANVTAILYVNDTLYGSSTPVAAFVGNEVRGTTNAILVNDTWMFFLTTYSNIAEGETLSFKMYVPEYDAIGTIEESIPFVPNSVIGNPQEPFVFNGYVENYDRAPEVSNIPDQLVEQGTSFLAFDLDNFLLEHNGDAVVWSASGNTQLTVSINQNNLATITYNSQFVGSEALIFTVRDNTTNQYADSDTAVFTVRPVDVPPNLGIIPGQTVRIGGKFSNIDLDNYNTASDGDSVTWSYFYKQTGLNQNLCGILIQPIFKIQ